MKPEAEAEMKAPSPKLSPDFAEKVLRAVDRKRRRRAVGASFAVLLLASVGLAMAVRPGPTGVRGSAKLSAADFAWLEEVGPSATSPTALLFPDALPSSGDDSPIDEATESL
jgi:hypothetical protein